MKRTALKRGTKGLARTLFRPKPKPHKRADPGYLQAKEEVERRDQGQCVACRLARWLPPGEVPWPMPCGGRLDPHHLWPTSWGGPLTDMTNIVTIHRSTHAWIDSQPREAAQAGLLAQSVEGLVWAQGRLREAGVVL